MARPTGDYEKGKLQLLKLIKALGGLSWCNPSTEYLATKLQKSKLQIQRYLKSLKEDGLIEVATTKPMKDPASGAFYKKRRMRALVKNVITTPNVLTVAPATYEEQMLKAFEIAQAEEAAREAAMKQQSEEEFDRKAVLLELQKELAEQGIMMEL